MLNIFYGFEESKYMYVFQKLQYLEKKRLITLADEHACYISPKLGFKQYKLYNNLSGQFFFIGQYVFCGH